MSAMSPSIMNKVFHLNYKFSLQSQQFQWQPQMCGIFFEQGLKHKKIKNVLAKNKKSGIQIVRATSAWNIFKMLIVSFFVWSIWKFANFEIKVYVGNEIIMSRKNGMRPL